MSANLTVVVAASIAAVPGHAGWTWAVLQYVLGLIHLRHRVWLVDPLPVSALRSASGSLADSDNRAYFDAVVEQFGIRAHSTLLLMNDTRDTIGLGIGAIEAVVRDADLVINVSGVLRDNALLAMARRSLYLDLDPVFTQLWASTPGLDVGIRGHSRHATIGWNIGGGSSAIPSLGLTWIPTLQPVVLERWTPAHEVTYPALTTVANWRGYGSIEHQGTFYGQKAHSLRRFMTLPRRTPEQFVLALGIDPGEVRDLAALAENGWQLLDPSTVTATPDGYQAFIRGSKAEFGIAKSGYVAARCGWFSDRSVCYLASGRPVLAQDTGLDGIVPTGEGIIPFSTEEDVLAAIEAIQVGYDRHARAAREIAEEYFDSDRVLGRLLDAAGA